MLKYLFETSKFISLSKILWKKYCYLEEQIDKLYRDSQTYSLVRYFCGRIKVYFRYSFLGRITEIRRDINFVILNDSKVKQRIVSFYNEWNDKIVNYSNTSIVMDRVRGLKKELYLLPAKTIGFVIIVAIITNVFLSILLKIKISPFGWVMRGLIFFTGIAGIFCNADWTTIISNSKILRRKAH